MYERDKGKKKGFTGSKYIRDKPLVIINTAVPQGLKLLNVFSGRAEIQVAMDCLGGAPSICYSAQNGSAVISTLIILSKRKTTYS